MSIWSMHACIQDPEGSVCYQPLPSFLSFSFLPFHVLHSNQKRDSFVPIANFHIREPSVPKQKVLAPPNPVFQYKPTLQQKMRTTKAMDAEYFTAKRMPDRSIVLQDKNHATFSLQIILRDSP